MKIPIKIKIIASFIIIIALSGLVATWTGIQYIHRGIVTQVQGKVRNDLNAAREIYNEYLNNIRNVIRLTAKRLFIRDALLNRRYDLLRKELNRVMNQEALDFLVLTDQQGQIAFRCGSNSAEIYTEVNESIFKQVMLKHDVISTTEILSENQLQGEGNNLAERARIPKKHLSAETNDQIKYETSGMTLTAAAPVLDNYGNIIGVLYGGILLNYKNEIVDKIKETVYQDEVYKGKDIGTATIFLKDLRISTNVLLDNGDRAIGTLVSDEVRKHVLINGLRWIERAYVVNDWYISAYEPIVDSHDKIIGMLYVGVLAKKYDDMKERTVWTFLFITLTGISLASIISFILATNISKPIKHLVYKTEKLAEGDLSQRARKESDDEVGELAEAFNIMAESLMERDQKLKMSTQKKIMESERLATIGQLAAGVAHELNNPLGGILVYAHLMKEKLNPNDKNSEHLEKIIIQTTRCKSIVKALLNFSHQIKPDMVLTDINEILRSTLNLLENQEKLKSIQLISKLFYPSLDVHADRGQIQQVFINIIMNAAEAMDGKGDLTMVTKMSDNKKFAQIEFIDTGSGIPDENREKIFEPFFTTKNVGEGIGLGLSICFGIIKKHNGFIEIHNNIKKGATITILLPVAK